MMTDKERTVYNEGIADGQKEILRVVDKYRHLSGEALAILLAPEMRRHGIKQDNE